MRQKVNVKIPGSTVSDPTALKAVKNVDHEYERFRKLLGLIFELCNLSGFTLEGRITLIDKRTGRVWK